MDKHVARVTIPEFSLVVLMGVSGSGKSTFARRHFLETEILSSDRCRGWVSNDDNDQSATKDAFEVLHFILRKRLKAGRLTVVDATNTQPDSRKAFVSIAREFHCLPVAVILDIPEKVAHERNKQRADRQFGPHVIRNQARQLHQSMRHLEKEGFRSVWKLRSAEEVEQALVERVPLWVNRRSDHGPFDIIGDLHGCYEELVELLGQLNYKLDSQNFRLQHPANRRIIFLGDLVDRGPKSVEVLRLVMNAVEDGVAFCVPGNHDVKLLKKLQGKEVRLTHGLAETMDQVAGDSEEFRHSLKVFLAGLISHFVLDDGKLVVAHAGLKEEMQGRASGAVREFALYGDTTGEMDELGLPVRLDWAQNYRGRANVIYGHTPVAEPIWVNRTLNIDTGCVYGGRLTALRYPEMELVSVQAQKSYACPARPFLEESTPARVREGQGPNYLLELGDVLGKRVIQTRLKGLISISEEHAAAALESLSRFGIDPKWLIYLPPTMSPCETSTRAGFLERPEEAIHYYSQNGVGEVICEEKHMGSRVVTIVCRHQETAFQRFGVEDESFGVCYTRTGRRFFSDPALESALLEDLREAITQAGWWEALNSDWFCFDAELMPWSVKAQGLIQNQYASVGAAGHWSLKATQDALEIASIRGMDVNSLLEKTRERLGMMEDYRAAYRRYCWPVKSFKDLKWAPFHLLASEGTTHIHRSHSWHMEKLQELKGKTISATPSRVISTTNSDQLKDLCGWWEELTGAGGEGMVVKPLDFIVNGPKGLVQPAIKCRGREYLRIIYGPEYTNEVNLERLRARRLGTKRSLAVREFALGVEALERFVSREPLRRVHEAVFGVLALESEPVDPRL